MLQLQLYITFTVAIVVNVIGTAIEASLFHFLPMSECTLNYHIEYVHIVNCLRTSFNDSNG